MAVSRAKRRGVSFSDLATLDDGELEHRLYGGEASTSKRPQADPAWIHRELTRRLWLSQAQMAELFQTSPQNVTLHLRAISEEATCKDYLQVRSEGNRSVSRQIKHYRLEAVLASKRKEHTPK